MFYKRLIKQEYLYISNYFVDISAFLLNICDDPFLSLVWYLSQEKAVKSCTNDK